MRLRPLAAGLVAAALVLGGCADDDGGAAPGAARVEVDTPQLRELRQQAGVEPCRPGTGEPVEGGLPDVTLPCLGGGDEVPLASLRGPMVVNLWASWCGPCRRELPILQRFHERHADRVPVLGIDWQDPQTESALELVIETGVTYPLLADPQADVAAVDGMPVRGLPGLVLLAEDGTVAYRALREIESLDQLEGLVAEHLGVEL